jgi:hypothetical protein
MCEVYSWIESPNDKVKGYAERIGGKVVEVFVTVGFPGKAGT